jgi:uncharacterized protein (TIGR02266 family)
VSNVPLLFREYVHLDRKRGGEGLSTVEEQRWGELKRMLGKRFSPGITDEVADKRGSLRVPTRMTVSFQNLGDFRSSTMNNLSRGGLFVATSHPAEIGTRFKLRIHIDQPNRTLEVPVVVVTQNIGPGFPAGSRGMGVAFCEMGDDLRERLEDLYAKALDEAVKSHL